MQAAPTTTTVSLPPSPGAYDDQLATSSSSIHLEEEEGELEAGGQPLQRHRRLAFLAPLFAIFPALAGAGAKIGTVAGATALATGTALASPVTMTNLGITTLGLAPFAYYEVKAIQAQQQQQQQGRHRRRRSVSAASASNEKEEEEEQVSPRQRRFVGILPPIFNYYHHYMSAAASQPKQHIFPEPATTTPAPYTRWQRSVSSTDAAAAAADASDNDDEGTDLDILAAAGHDLDRGMDLGAAGLEEYERNNGIRRPEQEEEQEAETEVGEQQQQQQSLSHRQRRRAGNLFLPILLGTTIGTGAGMATFMGMQHLVNGIGDAPKIAPSPSPPTPAATK